MPTVLPVVGDPGTPAVGEANVKTVLEAAGWTFSAYKDDNDAEPSPITEDMVIIFESCSSGTIGSKYQASGTPVLVLERGVIVNWNLSSSTGSVSSANALFVTGDGQPICDSPTDFGSNGTSVSVYANTPNFYWADGTSEIAASHITLFAQSSSDTHRVVVYKFDQGASLLNADTAAQPIVVWGMDDASYNATNLTADGESLFINIASDLAPSTGGESVAVGAVTETESAQTVTVTPGAVTIAAAAVTESEAAQTVTPPSGGVAQPVPVHYVGRV